MLKTQAAAPAPGHPQHPMPGSPAKQFQLSRAVPQFNAKSVGMAPRLDLIGAPDEPTWPKRPKVLVHLEAHCASFGRGSNDDVLPAAVSAGMSR